MNALGLKNKRVALIQPPRRGVFFHSILPIGLLSLASKIKQYGYEPVFIDLYLFSILKKNFSNYFKQMAEKIMTSDPDILGFGVMNSSLAISLLIAKECKEINPKLPIIFGGPEVSFDEKEVLETFKQVDIIVRGEGETTLVELLKALEHKANLDEIQGITFRGHNRIIRNPDRPYIEDLDQLPYLDYSLVPNIEMYEGQVEAGRGCPFSCAYCSTCKMWKRKFRVKSPLRLVRELKEAYRVFRNANIEIGHDHLLASRKFINEFLSLVEKEGITWACNSRLDALDEVLIKRLKQAGCQLIYLGIEAGSSEMQKKIRKNLPLEKLPRVLKMLKQYGIGVIVGYIIGFPNETESEIDQTLLMALNSKSLYPSAEIQLFLYTFLKGSEFHAKAKEKREQYEFRETPYSSLATRFPDEIELIKKYPQIFPSFYYIGNEGLSPKILQKIANLFLFLIRSYACQVLSLLQYLSVTPYQLGLQLISFFEEEGVEWDPLQGRHFPQYISPFKKFIRRYAEQLYKDFFWWEETFKRWEKVNFKKDHL